MDNKSHLPVITSSELAVLAAVPLVGRLTIRNVLFYLSKYELNFSDFWSNPGRFSKNILLSNKQIDSINKFKKEYSISSYLASLNRRQIEVVGFTDPRYPPLLLETADFPLVLFVKGNIDLLSNPRMIAVVGTRKITSYGRLAADKIVGELCQEGAVIVSGFMYGVDAAAHQSCLKNGGETVAVLGFGFDHMFPRWHEKLHQEILDNGGTIITEFPPPVGPRSGHFPLRNRIIAGMSQAVVVIEAAQKSGTFITAKVALEGGRLVGAVPGPITSPYSEGTKALLQQGALLVSNGREIIEELRLSYPNCWENVWLKPEKSGNLSSESAISADKKIYDMLMAQPMSTEKIGEQMELSVVKLNTLLTQLELNGKIKRCGASWTLEANQ